MARVAAEKSQCSVVKDQGGNLPISELEEEP
jgi:hypothetical protein